MSFKIVALISCMALSMGFAQDKKEQALRKELDELRREKSALESMRAGKLDQLEKAEASRWDSRYQQASETKAYEEKVRTLEDSYSRFAGDMGRLQDDLVKAQNEAKERQNELDGVKDSKDNFRLIIKQTINSAAENISTDIPIGIENSTLLYSEADKQIEGENPNPAMALERFYQAQSNRLVLGMTQSLSSRQSFVNESRETQVWRLQAGTVFVGELEKEGEQAAQMLLRTGSLQGKTFVWRGQLRDENRDVLKSAILAAANGKIDVTLPIDVLQNKSLGSGFVEGEKLGFFSAFLKFFKQGGFAMYPLALVGIFALFIVIEKSLLFWRRKVNPETFMAGLYPHVKSRNWQAAIQYCNQSKSSLARVLKPILVNAEQGREAAEKSVNEVMLKEIPTLEKRLSFLTALGTSAPLLGLLGTVSGLVAMFKVLNQLGSNDPKIMAGGISEALTATETGLSIAIPVLIIHGVFNEQLDTLSAVLNSRSMEVLNKIWPEGKHEKMV